MRCCSLQLVSYMPLAKGNCPKNAHSWLKGDAKLLLDTIYVDKQGSVSTKLISEPPRSSLGAQVRHW